MKDNIALSNEIFETAMDYLPRLINGLEKASQHFKNEETTAGMLLLSEASDGLTWFTLVVHGLPVLLPQGENTAIIEEGWQPYQDAVKDILEDIEKMDTIDLVKNLDTHIIPFIKIVYGIIKNLTRHIPYAH